jgi:hypothetical protein
MYARVAALLVREHRSADATPHERAILAQLLKQLCRDTRWLRFYVSQAAQARADELGIGDLSYFHWDHQRQRMKDPKRLTFVWEHVWTAAQLRAELLNMPDPTEETARRLLNRACGAWILRTEDKKLSDAGYQSERPRPFAAYRKVGIVLVRTKRVPNTVWIDPSKR